MQSNYKKMKDKLKKILLFLTKSNEPSSARRNYDSLSKIALDE